MLSTDAQHARAPSRAAHETAAEIVPTVTTEVAGGRPEGIRHALEAGRDVVVLGEAGIGKTYLVNLALRGRSPGGASVIHLPTWVHGEDAQERPATLNHLLGGRSASSDVEAGAERLWQWARERADTDRVVLRLEDAQLLDDMSLRVVQRVTQRPDVSLVTTTRADPSLPPLFGENPSLVRFKVRPLDTAGIETLLIDLLGGFPTADTVHRLWVATRGNPFHLCELVRDQRDRGTLVEEDGIWVWTGAAVVGRRQVDAVLHDLVQLDRTEREAVELAAVAGRFPRDVLPESTWRRLLRLGLLRPTVTPSGTTGTSWLEVAHPLQADAICAQVGTRRRRELLDRAREWRADPDATADDLVRSVARSVGAQIDVSLPELLRASGHAVRADDPHAALEITSAALRRVTADRDSIAILTARADAHLHLNDTDAALSDIAAARAALERMDPSGADVLDAYVQTVRLQAMVLSFLACDLAATLDALAAAARWLRRATGSGAGPARATRSVVALQLGHLAWGGRHAEMLAPATAMLNRTAHAEDVVPLVGPTVFGLALAGRSDEAEAICRRYLPVLATHPGLHRWEPGAFTLSRFFALVLAGEADAAERTGPVPGTLIDKVSLHQRRGVLAAARGEWTTARHELRAANVRLRLRDSLGILAYTLSWEVLVAAASGDTVGARSLLDELRSTPRRCSLVTGALLDLHVLDALIWLRDPGAVEQATALLAGAASDGMHAIELEALHRIAVVAGVAAARQVVPDGSLESRIARLAERVQGRRAAVLLAHLQALVGRQPRLAEAAAARLQGVGVGLPCAPDAIRLTRREREIAALAAGGMTSKAIAQRLVLSVRTVDSHLAGAYTKLGVHSREGLQSALGVGRR